MVGIADGIADATACAALSPVLTGQLASRLSCSHAPLEALLGELDAHRLDLVLAPSALPSASTLRGVSRLLSETDVSFFAGRSLARRLKGRFPNKLHGVPWLLPAPGTMTRRALDAWFGRRGLTPEIVAEFESADLLNAFGGRGFGVFCAPADDEHDIVRRYGVRVVGRTDELRARVYAIALDRRIQHPAVAWLMSQGVAPARDAAKE